MYKNVVCATLQPELAKSYGYKSETHSVITEDDYILTIHRLPGESGSRNGSPKPVVLFIHGIVCASDVWIVRGPGKDLGMVLQNESDSFYDEEISFSLFVTQLFYLWTRVMMFGCSMKEAIFIAKVIRICRLKMIRNFGNSGKSNLIFN